MIEVVGTLLECAAIFVGETVHASITLRNTGDVDEVLAWGTAQVHCQCLYNRLKISVPDDPSKGSVQKTSTGHAFSPTRGEKGITVFSSPAAILFCDLRLPAGESRTFEYSCPITADAPPSFRGELVSFSYKVTVGAQRIGASSQAELLRLPFRVLPVDAEVDTLRRREFARSPCVSPVRHMAEAFARISSSKDMDESIVTDQSVSLHASPPRLSTQAHADQFSPTGVRLRLAGDLDESVSDLERSSDLQLLEAAELRMTVNPESGLLRHPFSSNQLRNPFMEEKEETGDPRQQTVQALAAITRKRRPNVYKIGSHEQNVVKFSLAKQSFRLGEDVFGWFDFSQSNVPCYEIHVALECVETVQTSFHHKSQTYEMVVPHARRCEFPRHKQILPLVLPIPLASWPQFSHSGVNVRWQLSFEFVVGTTRVDKVETSALVHSHDIVLGGSSKVEADVLRWSLRINVFPTNPITLPSRTGALAMQF
eukprot:m.90968 g.90968  ORF g.90968 m.90968 type:complete len:482 (+) comp15285_c1_seq1:365-1810(+)